MEGNIATDITKFSEMKQFKLSGLNSEGEDVKKRINYVLSVIDRAKTMVDPKEKKGKENELQTENNIKMSEREKFSSCKSTSKMNALMESTNYLLFHETANLLKSVSSTMNLMKLNDAPKSFARSPFKQISNNHH